MSEKYILRTETDTLYLDKLIQKEEENSALQIQHITKHVYLIL